MPCCCMQSRCHQSSFSCLLQTCHECIFTTCRHFTLKLANSTLVCQEQATAAPGAIGHHALGLQCTTNLHTDYLGRGIPSSPVPFAGKAATLVLAPLTQHMIFAEFDDAARTDSWGAWFVSHLTARFLLMLGPQAALLATVLVHVLSACLPLLTVLHVTRHCCTACNTAALMLL